MPTEAKTREVEEFSKVLDGATGVVLTDFTGLDVAAAPICGASAALPACNTTSSEHARQAGIAEGDLKPLGKLLRGRMPGRSTRPTR
jgi:hypothetical protein